jgi:hypothetical protein
MNTKRRASRFQTEQDDSLPKRLEEEATGVWRRSSDRSRNLVVPPALPSGSDLDNAETLRIAHPAVVEADTMEHGVDPKLDSHDALSQPDTIESDDWADQDTEVDRSLRSYFQDDPGTGEWSA